MNICLTGRMKSNREETKEKWSKKGIAVQRAVGRNTDYLIVGEQIIKGASKIQKAKALGVLMLTEDEFNSLIQKDHPEFLL